MIEPLPDPTVTWHYEPHLLAVHCLLSRPNYGAADVRRLQAALRRRMTRPYLLCVHTDQPVELISPDPPAVGITGPEVGVARRPLNPKFGGGWWAKLGLWHQHEGCVWGGRRGLFFDLDTIIVSDLSPLLAKIDQLRDGDAIWLSDFYAPNRIASGVMAWTPQWAATVGAHISARALELRPHKGRAFHGDQDFAEGVLSEIPASHIRRWQDCLPGTIVSYKEHVCGSGRIGVPKANDKLPSDAAVVCFHGKPKPSDILTHASSGWLRRNWWAPGDRWAP